MQYQETVCKYISKANIFGKIIPLILFPPPPSPTAPHLSHSLSFLHSEPCLSGLILRMMFCLLFLSFFPTSFLLLSLPPLLLLHSPLPFPHILSIIIFPFKLFIPSLSFYNIYFFHPSPPPFVFAPSFLPSLPFFLLHSPPPSSRPLPLPRREQRTHEPPIPLHQSPASPPRSPIKLDAPEPRLSESRVAGNGFPRGPSRTRAGHSPIAVRSAPSGVGL